LETLDAIAACRTLIVTSLREGLPTLVMEGMALGKPLIVADEPGCLEAIGARESAKTYPLGVIDQLVERTIESIQGPALVKDVRQLALENYDWRVVARNLDSLYTDERRS